MVEERQPLEPTAFPAFPTLFTPEDVERLEWIKEQRRKLSEVYQAKFTPEAQARMFPLEKVAREFVPLTFLKPVVEAVTPWRWGWDFGMTPELFRAESDKLELEFKELARKQQVVDVLPLIQETLRNLALVGEDIGVKELGDTFKLGELGFTEEEIGFVVRYAMDLMGATPEQLVSGEGLGIRPVHEDEMDYLRAALPPRHIQTVVSLSQNVADITANLQAMYAPRVEDDFETRKGRITKAYTEMLRSTGVEVEEGESLTEASKRAYEKIAEQAGEPLILTDEQTGEMTVARKKADNTVWIGEELTGYYDKENNQVVPIGIQGQPLLTKESQEWMGKDYWDAWYLASNQAGMGIENLFTSILPDAFLAISEKAAPFTVIGDKIAKEESVRQIQEWRASLKAIYERNQLEFQEWYREHPELAPRPEWVREPEKPSDYLNAGRIGYIIVSNAPIMASALATGIGVGVLSGNPLTGAIAASALMTPVMISDLVEDSVANGASFEDATAIGVGVGLLMGAVEIAPWMIALRIMHPVFVRIFGRVLAKEAVGTVTKGLVARGAIGTGIQMAKAGLIITTVEVLEENIQNIMQNAVVKVFNEERGLLDNAVRTTIDTFFAVSPLAFMGGTATFFNMKANLPPKTQEVIDDIASEMKEAGLPEEQAEAIGLAKVLETEEGQAQVEIAAEKAEEVVPTVEEKPAKVTDQETKLTAINSDIDTFTNSIGLQEDRLTKLTIPFERAELSATIEGLREQLSELESKKARLVKRLGKLKEPVVIPEVTDHLAINEADRRALSPEDRATYEKELDETTDEANAIIELRRQARLSKNKAKAPELLAEAQQRESELNKRGVQLVDFTGKTYVGGLPYKVIANYAKEGYTGERVVIETLKPEIHAVRPDGTVQILQAADVIIGEPSQVTKPPAVEEPVAPEVPAVLTIDSIAYKLSEDYKLTVKETQFHNQNLEAIEQEVVRQREEVIARIREAVPKARVTLGRLIPDLVYEPSQTLPRLSNLEAEMKKMEDAVDAKPDIKKLIRVDKEFGGRKAGAEGALEILQGRLEVAKTEEDKKPIYEDFKKMAKDSGVGYKKLLASHWDDLTPPEQSKLVLSLIDNHSLGIGFLHDFRDTAPVIAHLEEQTGLPFYTVFERIKTSAGYAGRLQDEYFKRITDVPKWRKIVRDDKKMGQVALIIDSRRPGSATVVEKPATEEESLMVEIADEMLRVKKEWEPWIRFQRFIEAYEESSDIDSISKRILDKATEGERQALNADLQEAKDILERNGGLGSDAGENAIWHFLAGKTWGVIGSGYDSWRIFNPDLEVTEQSWAATRGAGYLMSRDTTQMPWNQQVGTLQRYDSYNLSMALRVLLTREIRHLAEFYNESKNKWRNPETVRKYLDDYIRAVQRYPERDADFLSRVSTRMMQWAYPNVFWHPRMGYRNILQVAWSFPYRDELVRSVREKRNLPPSLKVIGAERFALVVDMSGKPLRNWMFQDIKVSILGEETPALIKGTMGTLSKPLDFISALTAKIPTIAITDKATRSASFWSMMVKGWRAVEQYKKDGDAKKWFDSSGVNNAYITRPQQAYILKLFALGEETISWAAPGLQEVTGYEAATIKVAEEITDRTLYLYDRSLGAQFHRVGMRALKSLATFPRSTVQMYGMQFERVFNKESTASERTDALRKITMLWLSGQLLSAFLILTTGRKRGEYTLVNTITWSLGGLSFGLLVDIFDTLNDIFVAATGIDEDKAWAKQRVIRDLPRLTDVFVGFYSMTMDIIETTLDEPAGLDRKWLRDIKGLIEKDYTPGEVEKAERTVLEMVQKILFSTEAPDPDAFERAQDVAFKEEARLGEIDVLGKSYTTKQFKGIVKRTTGSFSDYLFIEEAGWSDLFLFGTYAQDSWQEYSILPTQPSSIRFDWREAHLEEEAMMLFWGEVSRSRFRVGTPEGKEIMKLLRFWWDIYDITPDKRPKATWEDGGKIAGTE